MPRRKKSRLRARLEPALLNAALYYRVHEVQLQLNVNNVLDKHYFIAGYDRLRSFPGAPRNVNLTATYRF